MIRLCGGDYFGQDKTRPPRIQAGEAMTSTNERTVFGVAWWPIDVAVAWMLTRDRSFLEEYWKHKGSLLRISIEMAFRATSKPPHKQSYENADDAWTELKGLLDGGKVRAVGTPFQHLTDLSGVGAETHENQRDIPDGEMSSLALLEAEEELFLVPSDWRVARGSNWRNLRGYRNVQVSSANLLTLNLPHKHIRLPSQYFGPPIDPHGLKEIPLVQAAYWIASEGGSVTFNFRDRSNWEAAFAQLIPKIAAGYIAVNGRKHAKGLAAEIPSVNFAGIAIDYPYSETPMEFLTGERAHIQSYGITGAEMWENEFYDSIVADKWGSLEYTHLLVKNADLAREFPFSSKNIDSVDIPKQQTLKRRGIQQEVREVYRRLWPNGESPARIKDRDLAIGAEFNTPPSSRTIRRALDGMK